MSGRYVDTTGGTADDRAQSNVIGAILLIVVTIILVSFVAVYVFGVGSSLQGGTPQASFTFKNDSNTLYVTQDGGQSLQTADLDVVVTWTNASTARKTGGDVFGGASVIETGDRGTVATNASAVDTVSVVYIDPNTGDGTTLAKYTA